MVYRVRVCLSHVDTPDKLFWRKVPSQIIDLYGKKGKDYIIRDTEDIPNSIREKLIGQPFNEFAIRRINTLLYRITPDMWENYDKFIPYFHTLETFAHYVQKDRVHLYDHCRSVEEVAKRYVAQKKILKNVPDKLAAFFDYKAYGEYMKLYNDFVFTEEGAYKMRKNIKKLDPENSTDVVNNLDDYMTTEIGDDPFVHYWYILGEEAL